MIVPTKIERDAIKREYGTLFASISAALFEADPVGSDRIRRILPVVQPDRRWAKRKVRFRLG
jgi:hypothetical protein